MMEKILRELFDFQRFSGNARLEEMIADTERRYNKALSDDELARVNAAGELLPTDRREDKPDD